MEIQQGCTQDDENETWRLPSIEQTAAQQNNHVPVGFRTEVVCPQKNGQEKIEEYDAAENQRELWKRLQR